MTKIFPSGNDLSIQEKLTAVNTYYSITEESEYRLTANPNDVNINQNYNKLQNKKNEVYTYHEYVQFKRARFNATSERDSTGRIKKIEFIFTGKFQ